MLLFKKATFQLRDLCSAVMASLSFTQNLSRVQNL